MHRDWGRGIGIQSEYSIRLGEGDRETEYAQRLGEGDRDAE